MLSCKPEMDLPLFACYAALYYNNLIGLRLFCGAANPGCSRLSSRLRPSVLNLHNHKLVRIKPPPFIDVDRSRPSRWAGFLGNHELPRVSISVSERLTRYTC